MSEPADLFTAKPINSAQRLDGPSSYVLRQARRSRQGEEDLAALDITTTLYVGNLSFFTTEEQIHELFTKIAKVKKIIMGLDRYQKTPCGFCFVEYYEHDDAVACLKYLHKTKLDERIITIDLDPGFKEGRQFGRGSSGGQVRDEFRQDYDSGRGGFGKRWGDDERGDDYRD